MIARIWHGAVSLADAEQYFAYLQRTGLRDLRATAGNRGVLLLRRDVADVTHFQLVSFWDSIEAIRTFAGDAVERARYYPEDARFLLALEPTVTHHVVLQFPGS